MRLCTKSLIGAWCLSAIAAWLFRGTVILFVHSDVLWLKMGRNAFAAYSTLDMVARMIHGAVFFLIVDAARLERVVGQIEDTHRRAVARATREAR